MLNKYECRKRRYNENKSEVAFIYAEKFVPIACFSLTQQVKYEATISEVNYDIT